MNKIRVGVIGCGYWGPNLIRNFSEISMSEVVAVADLREDRLKSVQNANNQISVTTNYKELFDMNLDAVVVATPPITHYDLARDVLEHGLHVLVEKPITTSSEQAERLIELADRKDLVLMVGHTFEYNCAVQTLKKLIDSGDLGKVLYVDTARLSLGLFQRDMNALWDLAPHDLSILMYILGKDPLAVEVFGTDCVYKGIHDVVYMNLVFPDNILAHIHVSWLDPCKVRRVTVVGSTKMVVYNDIEQLEKIKIYDKGVNAPDYPSNYNEFQCSYRYGDITIPNIKFIEPLRQECQHFLDCIVNHTAPLTSGEEGMKIVKILEAAQNSMVNSHHREVFTW
ncbi:MAG: Gfo/Idh/MocA family oxidoreductase [Anaerolineales bacterium]|nr:Gfo/Idh/MocA family oxidoreductase [Anaerolineales bacterium]